MHGDRGSDVDGAAHNQHDMTDGQDGRLVALEKRLELVVAMEHESRTLLQVTHAQLLHAQAARQHAEAQVVELEATLAQHRLELELRAERIRELKAQLARPRR